jgi:hypothetical protein
MTALLDFFVTLFLVLMLWFFMLTMVRKQLGLPWRDLLHPWQKND